MYQYYPINLNLQSRKCLVVGGGRVAERKVESLLECGAVVWVVSPTLTQNLSKLASEGSINYLSREYTYDDLDGCFLVVSAVDDRQANSKVANDCFARNILVNAVDDPEICNFIVPSVLRRGSLCIAVSTDGKSPALAKKIREEMESLFGNEYAEFLELMGEIRNQVLRDISDGEERRKIFECLINSDILEFIKKGQKELINEQIAQCMPLKIKKEMIDK